MKNYFCIQFCTLFNSLAGRCSLAGFAKIYPFFVVAMAIWLASLVVFAGDYFSYSLVVILIISTMALGLIVGVITRCVSLLRISDKSKRTINVRRAKLIGEVFALLTIVGVSISIYDGYSSADELSMTHRVNVAEITKSRLREVGNYYWCNSPCSKLISKLSSEVDAFVATPLDKAIGSGFYTYNKLSLAISESRSYLSYWTEKFLYIAISPFSIFNYYDPVWNELRKLIVLSLGLVFGFLAVVHKLAAALFEYVDSACIDNKSEQCCICVTVRNFFEAFAKNNE